ncbi:AAA domain-containing protein [Nocardia sp. NPDC050408]|uniref:AAA domain-containing protein n=1 Tax=Nocardia sp. NPDC050408 TaxID=3364319 RepID=UPI0037916D03
MTDSGTVGEADLADRASRLFRFLARVQGIGGTPILDADDLGAVEWLGELPASTAVRFTSGSEDKPFLRVDKVPVTPPIDPPEPDVREWLVPGPLDDHAAEPALRAEHVDGGARTERLVDHPHISERFDGWLRRWRAWAEKARIEEPAYRWYRAIYRMYSDVNASAESREAVLALGCVVWRRRGAGTIRRHALTMPVKFEFDTDSGTLTVRLDLDAGRSAMELSDFLDPGEIIDPALLRSVEREFLDGVDPFDRDAVAVLMRRLLHSLGPDSAFHDEMMPAAATTEPVGYYAPALIVRSRGKRGLTRVLDTIADRIEDRGRVPAGLRTLVDPAYTATADPPSDNGAIVHDGTDSFLPLPLNSVQLAILHHVDCNAHTIVQGPPGTGKTHTAAALITHLLAQGKRVLVTAHTDRALAEVRGKLPAEIRDLCVSVAGASRDSFDDLKLSMERIAAAADDHDAPSARRRVEAANARIAELRAARALLAEQLLRHREQEVTSHEIGSYRGTLTELVLRHRAEAVRYGWVRNLDQVHPGTALPVSSTEVREWRTLLLDDALADPEVAAPQLITVHDVPPVAQWSKRLADATERATALAGQGTRPWIEAIRGLTPASRAEVSATVRQVDRELGELSSSRDGWVRDAVVDVARGRGGVWHGRRMRLVELLEPAAPLTRELGIAQVRVSGGDRAGLVALAESVLGYVEKNGSIKLRPDGAPKVGITTNRVLKDAAPLFEHVRVDGRIPVDPAHLRAFLRYEKLERLVEQLDEVWTGSGVGAAVPGSVPVRLADHREHAEQLRILLTVGAELVTAGQQLRGFGMAEPDWSDPAGRRALLASFDAATALDEQAEASALFDKVATRVSGPRYQPGATTNLHDLHRAIEQRDIDAYQRAHTRLAELNVLRGRYARRGELDAWMAQLPRLREAVVSTAVSDVWDIHLADLEQAWDWAGLGAWLSGVDPEPVNKLFDQLDDIEAGLRDEATQLAVTKAWDRAVAPDRLGPGTRTDLRQYAQLVRRYGKGTGAHADRRRREIRATMGRCRSAVPVWIMPIYRVVEQLDIEPDMFDVVVVDEASQAGAEAVFLQYLAPRIVVIGDDRQVSPSGVGVKIDTVRGLAEQYLADNPHKASWIDTKRSLFDDAGMRFGSRLTLVEHRRCVPEIIGFSNQIAYRKDAKPLIPVRVFGIDRLPPIRTEYVADGVSTKGNLNEAEADQIVARVLDCLADPRYASKTFGVVSLLGAPQAELIWNKLLLAVPPEEIDRRQLRCGDAADFQGAERDVMFLSMVKAPGPDTRLMPQTDESAIQRYNVAASRAADQMWLFHSLRLEDLANPADMRYQLLDYCLSSEAAPPTPEGGELPAPVREDRPVPPFSSVFEQQVFNRILARRYRVVAHYDVGIHTLDMVVVGGHIRVAVLCEGDAWAGPQAYQKALSWQRDLERCGWPFFRVRQSQFVSDPERALEPLWELLDSVGLVPVVREAFEPDTVSVVPAESATGEVPVFRALPEEELLSSFLWDKPWLDGAKDEPADQPAPQVVEQVATVARVEPSAATTAEQVGPVQEAPTPTAMVAPEVPVPQTLGVGNAVPSPRPGQSGGIAEYGAFAELLPVARAGHNIASVKEDLLRIVDVEGPVTAGRLHAVVARVRTGDDEDDARITALVDRALEAAVQQGMLVLDDFLELGQPEWFSYRTPAQPASRLRLLGARAIEQVPPRELAEMLARSAESTGWADRSALMRHAASALGQTQLTDRAIAMLAIVLPIAGQLHRP